MRARGLKPSASCLNQCAAYERGRARYGRSWLPASTVTSSPAARRAASLLYQVEAEYLQSAKDEMIRLGGSPLGYVQQVLGFTDVNLKQLREIYLT